MTSFSVKCLSKRYDSKDIVSGVSIEVFSGEVVGLLGPNGAGKTTTLTMMAGIIKPDYGRILLNGKDITSLPIYKRAREGVTYLSQEPSIFKRLTVFKNIEAILEILNIPKVERKKRTEEFLDKLNISHLANSKALSLSGGERRKVEITRALVLEPRFMLLDEPFSGIDPIAVNDLRDIIDRLKNAGIGIIISDHDVRDTLSSCDRAYIMNNGEIIEEGTPEVIAKSQKARKFYLGEEFRM